MIITELCSFVQARNLLKKANEEVPLDLLNNIGVLHFERGEFEVSTHSSALLQFDTLRAESSCLCGVAISCFPFFQLASEAFREALGEGIWSNFFDVEGGSISNTTKTSAHLINSTRYPIDDSSVIRQYKDLQLFHRLEEQGLSVELPWNKVSALFNLARVLEQLHDTESASILYRMIIYKVSFII